MQGEPLKGYKHRFDPTLREAGLSFFTWYCLRHTRFEKKLRVALDWTLDLVFGKDIVQFQTFRAPTVSMNDEMLDKRARNASSHPAR